MAEVKILKTFKESRDAKVIGWSQTAYSDDKGLKFNFLRNHNSLYYYRDPEGDVHPLPGDGVVAQKKRLFGKGDHGAYTFYEISLKEFDVKLFATKYSKDVEYHNVITDLGVLCDISICPDESMKQELVQKMFSNCGSGGGKVTEDMLLQPFKHEIESVILTVIGDCGYKTAEDIQNNQARINAEIKKALNDPDYGVLFNRGFKCVHASINIRDDVEHRNERKRVQHNRALKEEVK